MLSRRLILLTKLPAQSILMIPEDKIERIEIPVAWYAGDPAPIATSKPEDVAKLADDAH